MKMQKGMLVGVMVLAMGATGVTAFAGQSDSYAEMTAKVTGRSVASVVQEHQDQAKPYGLIAQEAGKAEAFKAELFNLKKAALAEKVAAGKMTQERADAVLAAFEKRQAACTGTENRGAVNNENQRIRDNCNGTGTGDGSGLGAGLGNGMGNGAGKGLRSGNGNGLGNGGGLTCAEN